MPLLCECLSTQDALRAPVLDTLPSACHHKVCPSCQHAAYFKYSVSLRVEPCVQQCCGILQPSCADTYLQSSHSFLHLQPWKKEASMRLNACSETSMSIVV